MKRREGIRRDNPAKADKPPVPRPLKLSGPEADGLASMVMYASMHLTRNDYIETALTIGRIQERIAAARKG